MTTSHSTRRRFGMVSLFGACAVVGMAHGAPPASDPPPPWAFVATVPDVVPLLKGAWVSVPDSRLRLSLKRFDRAFYVPDWFPTDHPGMPAVVARGRPPHLRPCSLCHTPVGVGGPGSAAIAGLPAAYIEQQIAEFRSGRRGCAVPRDRSCSRDMQEIARAVTPAELTAAAEYFAHLTYRSRIRVIETARVPKTRDRGFEFVKRTHAGTEPIGERIIEVPDSTRLADSGDWRDGITAYVPPGSIARGRALVFSGAGAQPCSSCHGVTFQGAGAAPPLAGRSPTYIVRQLYDIRYGYRQGPAVAPMEPEVAHLTAQDRIDIAAYLTSLGEAPLRPNSRL